VHKLEQNLLYDEKGELKSGFVEKHYIDGSRYIGQCKCRNQKNNFLNKKKIIFLKK
jgi:hypothetical protein